MGRGKRTARAGSASSTGSAQAATDGTPTERFLIEPHYKQARVWHTSNPTGQVKDGYLVRDTLTGSNRRVDRKVDAKQEIERILEREAGLDWSKIASWSASFDRHSTTSSMEVHGHTANGDRVGSIALVARSRDNDETRQNVLSWLAAQDHPDLPELTR